MYICNYYTSELHWLHIGIQAVNPVCNNLNDIAASEVEVKKINSRGSIILLSTTISNSKVNFDEFLKDTAKHKWLRAKNNVRDIFVWKKKASTWIMRKPLIVVLNWGIETLKKFVTAQQVQPVCVASVWNLHKLKY